MFTRQVHLLDRLRGRTDPLVIDTLRELLGNCAAQLEHRGPIVLDYTPPPGAPSTPSETPGPGGCALYVRQGPVHFASELRGAVRTGIALADWEENGGSPRVPVATVIDGKAGMIWVSLPCPADQDPAVFQGQTVVYAQAPDGAAYAPGYGSAKLRTIKLWSGDPAKLAITQPGWRLCDGGDAAAGDKVQGKRPDLRGRFVVGYYGPDGTPQKDREWGEGDYKAIGDTGGYAWHGASDHGNNHPDHPNHRHELDTSNAINIKEGTGAGYWVWQGNVSAYTSGAVAIPGNDPPNWAHEGPFDSDTDNRPPYYVLAYLIRVR